VLLAPILIRRSHYQLKAAAEVEQIAVLSREPRVMERISGAWRADPTLYCAAAVIVWGVPFELGRALS